MNKFFRCLICLLLICSLMVSISPIQAEALSPGLAFAAGSAVASALIGLGISMGSDSLVHSELVQEAVEGLKLAGQVTAAGTVALVSLGSGRYAVRSSFIQTLFDWLYDRSVVSSGPTGVTVHEFGFATAITTDVPTISFAYRYNNYGAMRYYWGACSLSPFKYLSNGTWYSAEKYTSTGGTEYYCRSQNQVIYSDSEYYDLVMQLPLLGSGSSHYVYANIDYFLFPDSTPSTSYDLTLGHVALPGTSLATGYPAWHANSISIPNTETGEEEEYYPIAIGKTQEETQGFTQEDVWAGNGTYVDSEVVPGTGSGTVTVPDNATLKDILAGVLTIPQAISVAASNVVAAVQAIPAAIQAIPAAIADFFSVKGEVGSFTISLSDYFPFCIPFDLFNFFACLYADPVAPVIEWAIFERDGTAHPIIIDLSAYDSVAQLLRRLQLLLFCVGLAFKTRDLIKG